MPEWRTVKVKEELIEMAEKALETGRYSSLSDFVAEAIRHHLDELRQKPAESDEQQAGLHLVQERLLYSPNHMWTMVTPDGNIMIGLSDYAQRRLGGIAHIQTRPVGSEVKKQEPFGTVETWMFKFDLHSPVSGKVVGINKALLSDPSVINKDPYKAGWIALIEPNNTVTLEEEFRDLMKSNQYKTWASRLDQPRIPRS